MPAGITISDNLGGIFGKNVLVHYRRANRVDSVIMVP